MTLEYRVQLYKPDYLQTGKPHPVIANAAATMRYASNYTVGFSNVTSVNRVVLNRLTSSTHGQRFDQRQVVLEGLAAVGSTKLCNSPIVPLPHLGSTCCS